MRLVWLEFPLHYNTLLEQLRKPSHNQRVEHIYFEIEAVPYVESIEGYPFGKGDPRHVFALRIVGIPTVAHSQGVINGKMQPVDIGTH